MRGVVGFRSQRAQRGVEFYAGAERRGGVKDEAGCDAQAEHFFEAKGLGAKLDVVVGPAACGAFFVFDGSSLGDARGIGRIESNFNEVGFTGETKGIREERWGAEELPACAVLVAWGVHSLVGEISD